MRFRFTLKHQLPVEALQFENNEFEVSINGWDQINSGSDTNFAWNNPSSARASGATANTSAIGQSRPDNPSIGWPPGDYTIQITATNTSTGGSAPLVSGLSIFGSDTGSALDDSISYDGTGTWAVGAGAINREIEFTLSQHYQKLFFKFIKQGSGTGYNVVFTIDSIELIRIQGATDEQEISEPDGWKGGKLKLERDDQFFSLIERYEGAAGGAFIFYGDNGIENGGVDFIRNIEETYGFGSNIQFLAEFAPDDLTYEEIFNGLLELSGKNEMPDNKMQVPVIRDDFWAKFMSRMDTPVNLSDTVDLDGNPIDPVEPITVNLPPQKVRQKYEGYQEEFVAVSYTIPDNQYGQIDFAQEPLIEIDEKFTLSRVENSVRPSELFSVEYAGEYAFDIRMITSVGGLLSSSTDANLDVRLQINDDTAITLTKTNEGSNGLDGRTRHTYTASLYLNKDDLIRLYFFNNNAAGASYTFDWPANIFFGGSYLKITADTVFPATQAQGYLIHDLKFGILQRIGLGNNPFYSDFFGSQFTNTKQYDEDGCGWMYVIIKGLQLRGYTLTEKPFFISYKQIWDGINPILNIGLGYEINADSPDYQVIREEQKEHFVEDNISVYFSNVRDISSTYDQNMIFKTVKTGYKKGLSENSSGLDDYYKQTRATRFVKEGKEINLESELIAPGLAIEGTRRTTQKKSADYKYDNDNFIIALNQDDVSPDVYTPELDENFDSVSGLLNSDTRYNLILTPMRNLLRWANYLGGCLQSYTNSSYKFVSGEGNYDMVSDYSCSLGNQCQAIICDQLSESQDISLGLPGHYNVVFGYFFLPMIYDITIPMEWEEYQEIRNNRKKAIGISQTDTGHIPFKIKLLEYDLVKGEAIIKAWPKTFFRINVIDSTPDMECNLPTPDPNAFEACYQAVLDYGETI